MIAPNLSDSSMPHQPIDSVPLLPRRVPSACSDCINAKAANPFEATRWLVCPDGLAIAKLCGKHAKANVDQLREKVNQAWWLAPIYHAGNGEAEPRDANCYGGVRLVFVAWTESDHETRDGVWMSPREFACLLSKIRHDEDRVERGGYCKVRCVLHLDGEALSTRIDVTGAVESISINDHVQGIKRWQREQACKAAQK